MRTPEERMARMMNAGAFTVRHWRGILLSLWLLSVSGFGLIAWWGYQNRDRGLGSFVMTVFGLITIAMLMRFPRRLLRSMWDARGRPPQKPSVTVIDADGTVRDRPPPSPLPPADGPHP